MAEGEIKGNSPRIHPMPFYRPYMFSSVIPFYLIYKNLTPSQTVYSMEVLNVSVYLRHTVSQGVLSQ